MTYQPQRFVTPEGTAMVVLPEADFDRLCAAAEEMTDIALAKRALADIDAGMGTMPGEVFDLIDEQGLTPVAAWRRYRDISQADLARRANLSQVFVSKIERGESHGTPKTRKALALALDAPLWALDESVASDRRAQTAIQGLIVGHVLKCPGLTEAEIARAINGSDGYQQQVNQDCRLLVDREVLVREGKGRNGSPYRYHIAA